MELLTVRPNGPCRTCPYRRDVASGVWAAEEYEKLRAYDGSIAEQAASGATGVFLCHQVDGNICAGWAGCHDMHGTLAARMHARLLDPSVWDYESPVPLFVSGAEAAGHGEREIEAPGETAVSAIRKIIRVRRARGKDVNFS